MNILQALFSHLNASTNITVYSSNRIYPLIAPQQSKMPYITFNQISNVPVHAMGNDAPLTEYRIQISSWSSSFSNLIALSTAIKGSIRDLSGTFGTSNFIVQRIFFDAEYDFPEFDIESKRIDFHRSQDYICWTTN